VNDGDVARHQAGAGNRLLHGPDAFVHGGVGPHTMVSVAGGSIATELRARVAADACSDRWAFEDDGPRALAENEAVAPEIKGAAGGAWIFTHLGVIFGRDDAEKFHAVKGLPADVGIGADDDQRVERALRGLASEHLERQPGGIGR